MNRVDAIPYVSFYLDDALAVRAAGDMLARGYKAPYVARCLRAVDKRLAALARKEGSK